MASDRIVIRKYENRRLYDTEHSRYINLDEIARLVRSGREVLVEDARTGEDVTRFVLAQVILEESRRPDGLPLVLLREIVRASDRMTREFLQWVVTSASEQSRRMQDVWREQIAQGISSPWTRWSGGAGFPFWPRSGEPVSGQPGEEQRGARTESSPSQGEGSPAPPAPGEKPRTKPDPRGLASELRDLRRWLDDLEARVDRQRDQRTAPPDPKKRDSG